MAYRHSVSTRVTLLTRRFHPSLGHIAQKDKDDTESYPPKLCATFHKLSSNGSCNRINGLGSLLCDKKFSSLARPVGSGFLFSRYMSTRPGEWSDQTDGIGFIAEEVIPDKTVEVVVSQVPAINEVVAAAADSSFPVAALQYLIDGVHSFTGLNWWASIALTTMMIRGITVPLLINQLKATSKLNMLRPRLEELRQEMTAKGMDPEAVAEGQNRMQALFKEYGVTPFTPLKGLLIQGPIFISFFLAIRNMAEKVPSFKTGGALWFSDLTTPDSLFILPLLTALTFWITVECNMQEGLEGNPVAGTMKKFSRILAVVSVPVMISFPKALFCYWLTSNLFSLGYGFVVRRPEVKKLLDLPEIPVAATNKATHQNLSWFASSKAHNEHQAESPLPSEPSKVTDRKISPSSVLNQRVRTLEKQVKSRKKNKN